MLSRKALKEIQKARESTQYDFFIDETGKYVSDEPSNCYLRWTPNEGVYKGQTHILKIRFTWGSNEKKSYPRNPPNILFITPIWHTNVGTKGSICLDILKEGSGPQSWSPMYGLEAIFNSIELLMEEQNPNSPMNGTAGNMYRRCIATKDMTELIEHSNNYYYKTMESMTPNNYVVRLMNASEFEKNTNEKS